MRFPVMPLPERGGKLTLSVRQVSTPPGALGLSLIRGPGDSRPWAALGHAGIQHPEFHSTGRQALFILVHAALTAACFLMAKMILSGPDNLKSKKSTKM